MSKIFALRNDGVVFESVDYKFDGGVENALELAEWLYDKTKNDSTRNLIYELVASYSNSILMEDAVSSDKLLQHLHNSYDKCLSPSFVEKYAREINSAQLYELNDLAEALMFEYSQEFCELANSHGDMVFLISSNDFEWFDLIYELVHRCKYRDVNITILRSGILDLHEDMYYKRENVIFNHIPIEEFLDLKASPIIESIDSESQQTIYKRFDGKSGYKNANKQWVQRYYQYTQEHFSNGVIDNEI